MTFAITIYHWKSFYSLNFPTDTSPKITQFFFNTADVMGFVALNYFFFISGFLLYLGMKDRATCLRKIKSRIYSLGVPFLVWNTLVLIWNAVYCLIINGTFLSITWTDLLLGFSFDAFCGQFWYILALLILLPTALLISRIQENRVATMIFLSLMGVIAFIAPPIIGSNDGILAAWFLRFFNYVPVYLIGAICGLYYPKLLVADRSGFVRAIFSVVLVVCYLYVAFKPFYISGLYWLAGFLISLSIWVIIPSSAMKHFAITFPIRIAFFVYAMHGVLIGLLNTVLYHIIGYNAMPVAIALLVHCTLITVLYSICLLFAWVCKRFFPSKLYSMLSGGRSL